jgi:hypothetical protein
MGSFPPQRHAHFPPCILFLCASPRAGPAAPAGPRSSWRQPLSPLPPPPPFPSRPKLRPGRQGCPSTFARLQNKKEAQEKSEVLRPTLNSFPKPKTRFFFVFWLWKWNGLGPYLLFSSSISEIRTFFFRKWKWNLPIFTGLSFFGRQSLVKTSFSIYLFILETKSNIFIQSMATLQLFFNWFEQTGK